MCVRVVCVYRCMLYAQMRMCARVCVLCVHVCVCVHESPRVHTVFVCYMHAYMRVCLHAENGSLNCILGMGLIPPNPVYCLPPHRPLGRSQPRLHRGALQLIWGCVPYTLSHLVPGGGSS